MKYSRRRTVGGEIAVHIVVVVGYTCSKISFERAITTRLVEAPKDVPDLVHNPPLGNEVRRIATEMQKATLGSLDNI